jgi:hypothetical protein
MARCRNNSWPISAFREWQQSDRSLILIAGFAIFGRENYDSRGNHIRKSINGERPWLNA